MSSLPASQPPASHSIDPIDASVPDPGQDQVVSSDDSWLGKIVATEGMFVTDDRQRIRAWSAAAQRMLGYEPGEVVGKLCYQVVTGTHPDGHPVCGTSCPVTRNARRGRGTASYQVTALARDGSPRYLDNTVIVLEGPRSSFRIIHLLRESCDTPPARPTAQPTSVDGMHLAETLTRRELEVLRLFAGGTTLEEVASQLSISTFTARNHTTNIQHKLGVRNRLQMVLEGMNRGLI
jgi:PAS domain S-box-containing protein